MDGLSGSESIPANVAEVRACEELGVPVTLQLPGRADDSSVAPMMVDIIGPLFEGGLPHTKDDADAVGLANGRELIFAVTF